ncbi:hypothetical protein Esti_004174 [Eimeria stiedai]
MFGVCRLRPAAAFAAVALMLPLAAAFLRGPPEVCTTGAPWAPCCSKQCNWRAPSPATSSRLGIDGCQLRTLPAFETSALKALPGVSVSDAAAGEPATAAAAAGEEEGVVAREFAEELVETGGAVSCRLAQPFVSQLPLIEGHGNFGSIDGDPAAAMRYTECRLSAFCQDALLKDLHTSACSFKSNFDATEVEPEFLPARVPLLLLQGSAGVAVGLASNIPPHNLNEVVDACMALIDNPRISDSALHRLLPAPDFPTGGVLVDPLAAAAIYKGGHGSLRLRARAHLETKETPASPAALRRHRSNGAAAAAAACATHHQRRIIVTELPYGVDKGELVRVTARLAADNLLPGISQVHDESDFSGVRVAFTLLPEASPRDAWKQLTKRTPLEVSVQCNFVALKDGVEPKRFSVRGLLEAWLRARLEAVRARAAKEQQLLQQQQHINEGLAQAAKRSQEILSTITQCTDTSEAISKLTSAAFGFSDAQAGALLRVKLSSLLRLQQQQQQQQLEETARRLETLKCLLADDRELYGLIKKELQELVNKHGVPRKTLLMPSPQQQQQLSEAELALLQTAEDTPEAKDEGKSYLLLATTGGLYKRVTEASVHLQRRGTSGLRCHSGSSSSKISSSSKSSSRIAAAAACRDADWLLFVWRDGHSLGLCAAELQRHGLKAPPSLLPLPAVNRRRSTAAAAAAAAAGGGLDGMEGCDLCCVVRVKRTETQGRLLVATKGGLVKAVSVLQLLPLKGLRRIRWRSLVSLPPGDVVADCALLGPRSKPEHEAHAKQQQQQAETAAAAEAATEAAAHHEEGTPESVVLATARGRAVRFSAESLRTSTPEAGGNKGISLRRGDSVVSAAAVPAGAEETGGDTACLLLVTTSGMGKRLGLKQLKLQRRGGSGSLVVRLAGPRGAPKVSAGGGHPPQQPAGGGPPEATEGAGEHPAEAQQQGRGGDNVRAVRWVGDRQQQVALVSLNGAVLRQRACSSPRYTNKLAKGVRLQRVHRRGALGSRGDAVAAAALLDEQHESPEASEAREGDTDL